MMYSKTINLENPIILAIYFHKCGYEYVFLKLQIFLGVDISSSLSIQINRIYARQKYERVYKENTHVKMLISQRLQK